LKDIEGTAHPASTYRQAALTIISTLTDDSFLGASQPDYEGILRHGVYHRPMNWGVDESVMWGDYFFMEALQMILAESSEA
jgi:unsaturated chondroitin disaccharide hydrolase